VKFLTHPVASPLAAATDFFDKRAKLQQAMIFLGAIASGMEQAVGESANNISYLAGKNLGIELSEGVAKTKDLELALSATKNVLLKNNYLWMFETFKPHDRPELVQKVNGGSEVMLVFRDCMIRQSLFRFGHVQNGSLCNMMFGFFAGALQNVMGRESTLEVVYAGQNACYKRLIVKDEVPA
jgi:predicted hydrocarbon binding protein